MHTMWQTTIFGHKCVFLQLCQIISRHYYLGSGGVLRSVDDTCHGSRSTQSRKLAFLVLRTSGTTPSRQPHQSGRSHHCCRRSFRPGDVRLVVQRLRCYQQCRAVGDTARFVQWGSNLFLHVGLGSWRGATAHRRRALHPLFMTALEKFSTLLLDVKHTRTQYDSLITQGTYQRSRDRLSRKWPTTLRRAGRTYTLFWRRFPTVEVPNVEACFAISVRFKGEGGGLRMKLTFFVSQASANFCDGP